MTFCFLIYQLVALRAIISKLLQNVNVIMVLRPDPTPLNVTNLSILSSIIIHSNNVGIHEEIHELVRYLNLTWQSF
jgi:3-dehydroquinate synthase class II